MSARRFVGRVWHARRAPVEHRFAYPHAWLALPLPECDRPSVRLATMVAWQRKRHGAEDGSALLPWLQARLAQHGVSGAVSAELHTLPCVLGRVFNPASFYVVRGEQGALLGFWVEVRNTFGERHDYFVPPAGDTEIAKALHVSPFFKVEGGYRFAFNVADNDRFAVRIDYLDTHGTLLFTAGLDGHSVSSRSTDWLMSGARHWLMGAGVWLHIHLQAWRLWRRGAPFFGRDGRPHPAGLDDRSTT